MKFLKCFKYGVNEESTTNKQWPQIVTILIVTISAFSAGQLFTWTSFGIPYILSDDFPLDVTFSELSYLAVVPSVATILFSPISAYLLDKVGRKSLVIFINIPYLIAFIILAYSKSLFVFYLARFIGGVGDAVLFFVLPSYLGEIAEPKVRGSWGNAFSLQIYLGQLATNVIGSYLNIKMASLVCAIAPAIGIVTALFIPESPYFLLIKNKEESARNSLKWLRGRKNVEEEFAQLSADVKRQLSESGSIKSLFVIKANRKALIIAALLRIAQQFAGISAFSAYTQYIFQMASSDISKTTSSMIFAGVLIPLSLFAAAVMDKLGRRLAVIISCAGSGIALTIESIYFYCSDYAHVNVSNISWVPLCGLLLYLLFFSVGIGLAPSLMQGELFSASIKGKALSVMVIVISLSIAGSTLPFQALVGSYGLFAPFALYATCSYVSVLFTYFYVPETKGKTLEQIQQILKGTKPYKQGLQDSNKL